MMQKKEMNRRILTARLRVPVRCLRIKLRKLMILNWMSRKKTCYSQMTETEVRRMKQLRYRKKEQPEKKLPPVLK